MIYRKRSDVSIPKKLDGPSSRGGKETANAIKHYESGVTSTYKKFKVYRDKTVKTALIKLFEGKCAYCESFVLHVYSGDVEHFRPKGRIAEAAKREPGYYWLAADWNNLLFSCRNCNQKLTHRIHGIEDSITMGKMDQFPLVDEKKRVRNHTDRAGIERENEYRLLINPCEEDPDNYFCYDKEHALIKPKSINGIESEKAKKSIEVYVLQRLPLVLARERVLIEVLAQIQRVKEAVLRVNDNFNAPNEIKFVHDKILQRELTKLKAFMGSNREYSAMCKQVISDFFNLNFN